MFQNRILSFRSICCKSNRFALGSRCARFASSWKDLIDGSEVLYSYKTEVTHDAMLVLRSACNTIIRSKYQEEDPYAKEATVTIYGKPENGIDGARLKTVVQSVNNFRNIVRYKSEGWPHLLLVSSFI